MERMSADIFLLVAEKVDRPTLGVLMRLSKTMNSLLGRYQTSIVKSRITMQKLGDGDLTLYTHHGRFFSIFPIFHRPYSFPMLETLAAREQLIDEVIESYRCQVYARPAAHDGLGNAIVRKAYYARVTDSLRHASAITDRLSDCRVELWVASATVERLAPDSRRVRCAQIAVLQSLSFCELAFLARLLQFSTRHWDVPLHNFGAAEQVRITIEMSHENVLRHGVPGLMERRWMDLHNAVAFAEAKTYPEVAEWRKLTRQEFEDYVSGFDFVSSIRASVSCHQILTPRLRR